MCVFCFQAEDGIRDLVRSRGLGDVYKRQSKRAATHSCREPVGGTTVETLINLTNKMEAAAKAGQQEKGKDQALDGLHTVSYTHLTLPTSDLV